MRQIRLLFLFGVFALAACASDPCTADHTRRIPSPSAQRYATVFVGPCPGTAPQILIGFDGGSGGAGIFAVSDSVAAIDARWIAEDTLQVIFPRGVNVIKRDSVARYKQQAVSIIYRVL